MMPNTNTVAKHAEMLVGLRRFRRANGIGVPLSPKPFSRDWVCEFIKLCDLAETHKQHYNDKPNDVTIARLATDVAKYEVLYADVPEGADVCILADPEGWKAPMEKA